MMSKKITAILFHSFIVLIVLLIVPVVFGKVAAATLKFDKTTYTVAVNGTFQVQVMVDPGSDQLNSVDAYILYDSNVLKVQSVANGTLFPNVNPDTSTAGTVYIAAYVSDPASSISTGGTIATITFQGLTNGTATLTFDCTSSKIVKDDVNATNVMQCAQNGQATVTVGSGGATATSAPTPSVLPRTGIIDNVAKLAVPGAVLLFLGYAARLIL